MPGRSYTSSTGYRYGFGSQEKVDEISGAGNHNTALYWEYDTRLGRRWNIDPVEKIGMSGYMCFSGDPISHTDINGDDDVFDRNGNFLFSTKSGSLIKIVTPEGIQLLSQFTSEKGHSLPAAKIVDYYKVDAGFKKKDRVGVSPNYHGQGAAYTNRGKGGGSFLNTNGGSDKLADDSKNLVSIMNHEHKHKVNGSVSSFQDHLDVYSAQMDDKTFEATTADFKVSMAGSYANYLAGGYLQGEFQLGQVAQKIVDFNKKYEQYNISIVDNTTITYQLGITLQAEGKDDEGKPVTTASEPKTDPH